MSAHEIEENAQFGRHQMPAGVIETKGLAKGCFKVEPAFFQASDIDQLHAPMFRIRDSKIIEAQNFLTDMYQSDAFFWAHYPPKPLPEHLAPGVLLRVVSLC